MAEPARRDPVGPARLPDEEVRARLVRLEETLELIEKTPGPAGELGLSAVAELAHIYGEALARAPTVTIHSFASAAAGASRLTAPTARRRRLKVMRHSFELGLGEPPRPT